MDFWAWLGRFHPALVHFPIGIIVVGIILYYINRYRPEWKVAQAISPVFFIGFISALLAALCGWMLAEEGGYDTNTLFWHRWLGVGIVLLSFGLWWWHSKDNLKPAKYGAPLLVAGILVTGHLGGNLTHGEGFLVEKGPEFLKKLTAYDEKTAIPTFDDPDSCNVFHDLIYPVLESKCISCHNSKLRKGGLDMSNTESLMKGGRNGEVIEGESASSEIFKRVVLDPSSRKYMPPKGTPMSYREIKLLEWWIDAGAHFDKSVSQTETPKDIAGILLSRHKLDITPKSFLEKTKVPALEDQVFVELEKQGFAVQPLAMTSPFIDVRWKRVDSLSLSNALESLQSMASEQVAWLDLGESPLSDADLANVAKCKNLVRLKLQKTPVSDDGVKILSQLKHLESLNLYGTKITNSAAEHLSKMSSLRNLYVWQTGLDQENAENLETSNPDLEVVLGVSVGD